MMAETGDQHGPVIGIDLGTACSCVAVWQNGRAEIVTNEHGGRATPSYAAFTDTERLVGDAAKSQASRNPTNTVFGESVVVSPLLRLFAYRLVLFRPALTFNCLPSTSYEAIDGEKIQ
jgi:hypothetical protein